jgi:hypothetical protein
MTARFSTRDSYGMQRNRGLADAAKSADRNSELPCCGKDCSLSALDYGRKMELPQSSDKYGNLCNHRLPGGAVLVDLWYGIRCKMTVSEGG